MSDKHALPRNTAGPESLMDAIFLSKYIATDRALVFRLSNNVIQVTKLPKVHETAVSLSRDF